MSTGLCKKELVNKEIVMVFVCCILIFFLSTCYYINAKVSKMYNG